MKLSKAQQSVMDWAKKRIDYARSHDFYDWYRDGNATNSSNQEIDEWLDRQALLTDGFLGKDYETERYQMNKDGIDYLCVASSTTIRKLEKLGLIKILKEHSKGVYLGADTIKILNY